MTCQNAFAQIPQVHEFEGLFELVSVRDVSEMSASTCIDLESDGTESDICVKLTTDPNKVPFFGME